MAAKFLACVDTWNSSVCTIEREVALFELLSPEERLEVARAAHEHQTTALHMCCSAHVMRELIELGADVCAVDGDGLTPLHTLFREVRRHGSDADLGECCRVLLRAGADPLATDCRNRTPVQRAVECNEPAAAEQLLQAVHEHMGGATASALCKQLLRSVPCKSPEVAEALLRAVPDAKELHAFMEQHGGAAALMALNRICSSDWQFWPRYSWWVQQAVDVACMFLRYGADPHAIDKNGKTLLHLAARLIVDQDEFEVTDSKCMWFKHSGPNPPEGWKEVPTLDALLQHGLDPRRMDNEGITPLMECREAGAARALVLAVPEAKRSAYMECSAPWRPPLAAVTAAQIAAQDCHWGVLATLAELGAHIGNEELLLRDMCARRDFNTYTERAVGAVVSNSRTPASALVNTLDSKGTPLLTVAVISGNLGMVRALMAHGADVGARDAIGCSAAHHAQEYDVTKVLVEQGADVGARDDKGRTPLHDAVVFRRHDNAIALLDCGADVNAQSFDGCSPLHLVMPSWSWGGEHWVELLVDRGANINLANKCGRTPLHMACESASLRIVQALVGRGADIYARCNKGRTPLGDVNDTSPYAAEKRKFIRHIHRVGYPLGYALHG